MTPLSTKKHLFLKGRYWVGDVGYLIPDKNWDDVIEKTGCFGNDKSPEAQVKATNWDSGVFSFNNYKCFAYSTLTGDGSYELDEILAEDMLGFLGVVGVDSGLIGIMPVESVPFPDVSSYIIQWYRFPAAFEVYRTVDGVFRFGNLRIETN